MPAPALKLSLEIDNKRFADARKGLNALSQRVGVAFEDLSPIARKELQNVLDTVKEAMRKRHSTPWQPFKRLPAGDRGGKLAKRSGKGLRGIRMRTQASSDEVTGWITVDFPMSVHEKGAIVRRKSKLLAIPLPAALDARGVPKKLGPRLWSNTFVAKSRKGNLLIFQRRGGKIIPLYALKEKVVIPARLGLGVTLQTAAPLFVDRVFNEALKKLRQKV